MALTREQMLAIVEVVYDRAARGEPYLTPRLAQESRNRRDRGEATYSHRQAPANNSVPPPKPRTPSATD